MGWTNSHLHQYVKDERYYSIPHEYDWHSVIDEREIQLGELAPNEGDKFVYEYDFGDSWDHTITVEKIIPIDSQIQYPHCVKGKRACPPEDVGGIWGYEEFVEAMKDSSHEAHDHFLEWWGEQFDPEEFDLNETNKSLQKIDEIEWWDDIF